MTVPSLFFLVIFPIHRVYRIAFVTRPLDAEIFRFVGAVDEKTARRRRHSSVSIFIPMCPAICIAPWTLDATHAHCSFVSPFEPRCGCWHARLIQFRVVSSHSAAEFLSLRSTIVSRFRRSVEGAPAVVNARWRHSRTLPAARSAGCTLLTSSIVTDAVVVAAYLVIGYDKVEGGRWLQCEFAPAEWPRSIFGQTTDEHR